MYKIRKSTITIILLTTLLFSPFANAITTIIWSSSPVTLTMTVIDSCTVAANNLAFGSYTSNSASVLDINTTINVTCTGGTPYKIGLDAGVGTGATVTTRKLKSGANLLNYSLYRSAARTLVWGNTVGTNTLNGTGDGTTNNITVYGRIFSGQAAAIGSYNDTITVTVTF